MKTYKLFAIAAASLFVVSSCSLEEYNPSNISTSAEWSTAEGYKKKIVDCYFDMVRIIYGQAEDTYVMSTEAGTDIWQDANPDGSNGNWSKVMRYTDFGGSVYMFNEGYTGLYGTLNACNAAIQYADKVQGLSQNEINALVAEAHFIRAHVLFNIVELWGGKYLATEPTSGAITKLPISSINEFYKVIFEDLEFAKTNLPITQSVRGHVVRAAAYHLIAKAALTYATYTDGLGNATALTDAEKTSYLNKAKEAAEYLINNASTLGVKLYDESAQVFDEVNNKNNTEALFIVTHSTITTLNPRGNYFNRCWKHTSAYNNNNNGIYLGGITPSYETTVSGVSVPKLAKDNCYMEPSKYMLNLYGEKDTRYAAFFSDVYYVNKATNSAKDAYTWAEADAKRFGLNTSRVGDASFDCKLGDTAIYLPRLGQAWSQARKDATRYGVYNQDDNYANNAKPLRFYPSLKKYMHPSLYCGSNASKPYSASDCIIYRLGETYLLAAEASYRLGNKADAVKYVNVIRNRACAGHDGSMNVTEAQITDDFMLDEYAREMIGEWQRWFTLKRFRAFESRLAACNPQITTFKKDYYFRPIQDSELLLIENPDEYQNPGY